MIIESPVSPVPNFLALGFVILTTAIKQGYEDFKRHRADRVINHRHVIRIEANGIQEIQSQKIQVGDVICVEDGDEFPCDMLILSSSNPNGKVTIMTANLDGETNLKTHSAPQGDQTLDSASFETSETSETSETRELQGERSEPCKLLQKLQNWKDNCWQPTIGSSLQR